jgi:hypothetical protein
VPGADILVKVMPPHFVSVTNLEYSGGLNPANMRVQLQDYINKTLTTRIDKSDIINLLYDNGATFVNTSFTLGIESYSTEFIRETQTVADTYEIPTITLGRLFTNPNRLLGMVQV